MALSAQDFRSGGQRKSNGGNDPLRLASTWHGINEMAKPLSPVGGWGGTFGGIEVLESDGFCLHCFHARTGTKFFAVTEARATGVAATLKQVYVLFADYVLKNPFYEVEMPIRVELFDHYLTQLVGAA